MRARFMMSLTAVLGGVLVASSFAAFSLVGRPSGTTTPTVSGTTGVTEALRLPFDRRELIRGATVIVVGVVESVGDARWSTPDGNPPGNLRDATIYRPVRFRVERTLKGDVTETLEFRVLGGRVGNIGMTADDFPDFQPGERDVLFMTDSPMWAGLGVSIYSKYQITNGLVSNGEETMPVDRFLTLVQTELAGQ